MRSPTIGKEANQLEDTLVGLVADQDETLNHYDDAERIYCRDQVVPVLRQLGIRETARRLGFSAATVHDVLVQGAKPRPKNRSKYVALAESLSRHED